MTDQSSPKRVVILGGYGVFGGKLALALLRDQQFDVVVAGRNRTKAQAFCEVHGGLPVYLDRHDPAFGTSLAKLKPFVVVDASGPFQNYAEDTYSIVMAALAAGSHYLDLSDDANFTSGISELEQEARSVGKTALSGVSSVPALSSVAVEAMRSDFLRLDFIESAILPGNRAPRGLAVMRAILGQTGRPIAICRDGTLTSVPGWSGLERRRIGPRTGGLPPRWTSFIGAPDLQLFPERYGARTVLFRAGLELSVMHLGLWALSWLTRLRLITSLEPLARSLRKVADWLAPFGSDRGGMEVRVAGLDKDGLPKAANWTLIAEAGDGPSIPAVAATILCNRLAAGSIATGARSCLAEFSLEEIDEATSHLSVKTFGETDIAPCLFQQAMGDDFAAMPGSVRNLHTVFDRHVWSGTARVSRGQSMFGNLLCRLIGFPPEAGSVPVAVTIERHADKEFWSRNFGGKTFRSVLSLRDDQGKGHVCERFGPLKFDIDLTHDGTRLYFPVARGRFLGCPLPKWILPESEAFEFEENGRFNFDVRISLPGIGMLVRYQGWLEIDTPLKEQSLKYRADT